MGKTTRAAEPAPQQLSMHAGHAHQEAEPRATPALGSRPDGSHRWRVIVGGFEPADGIDAQAFFPGEITINAGDGIHFDFGAGGFHTVTLLSGQELPPMLIPEDDPATPTADQPRMLVNPDVAFPVGGTTYDGSGYLNSGIDLLRDPGDPFVLTFTEPGEYSYVCVPHSRVMAAHVIVQDAGASLPYDQADYDAMAEEQLAALLGLARADFPAYREVAATPQADGSTLWEPTAGVGIGQAQVMRFLPDPLEIKVGDTVRWVNRSPGEGHTVTFLSGGEAPKDIIVEPQTDGPPRLIFNPDVLFPTGGPEYDGTGYVNSGFFGEPFGPPAFELTFTAPGRHEYICVPHAPMQMVGAVNVAER
jgi:plastocyanin